MTTTAIIVAAGRGRRMGGEIPKQFMDLDGIPVIARTLARFQGHSQIDDVFVVLNPSDADLFRACTQTVQPTRWVAGGESRDASVRAGLAAVADGTTRVLIHDAARPLVSASLISRVIDALEDAPGAAPALAVTDALWRGEDGKVLSATSREGLYRAQTPQGFDLQAIRAAHEAHAGSAADDVEVARAAGLDVVIVEGEESNLKLTTPPDFLRAAKFLTSKESRPQMDIRLGNGFDVHRFTEGDAVILCGVSVPHSRALLGHSDADVGMHAVTDAIYGALAEGDIGRHFPPSDPQWKGAASDIFLRHAVKLAGEKGFTISNVDCTLICERPKIGPYAAAMQAAMAAIMGMDASRVSIKATTSERLGFTGREEGIAALATATLVKP
ncbi:bifunctional 2-C-methyl-D-erythritol 4-phosphate cytidylyltransferase/2-C-methyl-D-erythritol 2,4-cyclodiphosphate synthase [Pseudoruegeria sp. SHC-113]|uniref:bifunctional 2-C-methyl-D-erythritol 4-phosphate cytidylyltransferase/2-C-methyl-D-erythritol 2,4-cyclodiphosphate synthase n=1 Tax=Pseudoruegeria sp. SHC-113 TaxID=2855439 RepID=UPI0021BB8A4B|nr:bifunctional 2-C-methyl-D-erythritol 4-phosphate cytidylyltransferase/2-C-methyl-D-erythritol 2,4-cyclodiphosphate synthase [Pseudoruegeria sp. SHC-113]MCT8160427.1 bifunctional 2-C-methyl-D-erythritol 4-phosphate cytidylyltransferase/2-C-methyl-D-erythritol 2,4-cyclodiphosphate synthase [Pseudoruegeria sp. SHC-113]